MSRWWVRSPAGWLHPKKIKSILTTSPRHRRLGRIVVGKYTVSAHLIVRVLGKTAVNKIRHDSGGIFAVAMLAYSKRLYHRIFIFSLAMLIVVTSTGSVFVRFFQPKPFKLTQQGRSVIAQPNKNLSQYLIENEQGIFEFNEFYKPSSVNDSEYDSQGVPRIKSSLHKANGKVTITDPQTSSTISITPKFEVSAGRKDENQVIHKLKQQKGFLVYTNTIVGMKEDILLLEYNGDDLEIKYELSMPESIEARIESDGSIGFYGSSLPINGDVATGNDSDKQLLESARKNAEKNKLLFTVPRPIAVEADKKESRLDLKFSIQANELSLSVSGLDGASFPLSIDPSVYVETARKLMRGNNETNVDFDVDDELIQKSQTTGARIDAWQGSLDVNEGIWGHSTVTAGGYLYRTGGRTGATSKPSIVDQTRTLQGSNSSSFTMDMPSTRPAGDLYVAIMCHDGTNVVNPPSGGGWTEYADVSEYAAYYKIGTDQGGGNESSSYTWTGSNEEWGGVIMRITGFDSGDPVSGTPGIGSSGGAVPVFPATTPDVNSTLIIRSAGADQDDPSATGWVPSGHTKIDSESSSNGGNGSCAFVAAAMDSPPAATVSTGTVSLADSSINDSYGASSLAINPVVLPAPTTRTTVEWARFDSATLDITSPNPGTAVCSGWCNQAVYNLPSARRNHTMVAYNGYLYVIGGVDSSGTRVSTVYVAKIGANGEPSLWHPTDTNKSNWVYWYSDSGLSGSTALSYLSATAYNNRMYVTGGQSNASPGGIATVYVADILPNGKLGLWTTSGMQALPAGAGKHMHEVQIYNGVMYAIGGFEGVATSSANLRNTTYYSKLNSDGTMNAWQQTKSFVGARSNFGGSFSYIWGAYIYVGGGCLAVNASGYCTLIDSNTLLASINADGSLDNWSDLGNLDNTRIGYSLIGWQGGLYRLGGCNNQDSTTGECTGALTDVDYGIINPAGEVSTVNISEASGSGNCTGGAPEDCDLPPLGDGNGQGGQMLSGSTILNGYLYIIGGCTNFDCSGSSGNVSYVSIGPDGSLQKPATCSGTSYGAWCVDSSNRVNGTSGVSAPGITTFNNRIYVVGGIDESSTGTQRIYYNSTNTNGSLSGAWSSVTFASAGMTTGGDETGEKAYTYAYSRANPAYAGSNPGNLYVMGGCSAISASAGCSSSYNTSVYKCNITTSGSVSGCTTTGQLQLDTELGTESNQGLGLHSGTVYANYIYLIGGYSDNVGDRASVFYAKFDNSNNIVDVESGTANPASDDDDWIESTNSLNNGRRRGWAFGYNGHIYAVGGYDSNPDIGIIPFIEWSKMNVSDGSVDSFVTSSVTLNQRWGLSMTVSNSYAYVIGGCDVGASPGGCSSFEPSIQTFQLYNNNSGSVANFTAQSDQTFSANTDRRGASSAVYNGYLYVAGGCISAAEPCTTAVNNVQYAPISATDGSIGTWAAGGSLPAVRAWGSLQVAGGSLYYIGGQDSTATNEQATVYYTTSISAGNPTWNGATASNGLPGARTKFSATVWNNRLYVVGGLNASAAVSNTVYVSPQLSFGGDITSAWTTSTAFNVARTGAAVTAYANNLYLFGGNDGTNYLSDVQYTQINSDGTVDAWSFTKSLPGPLSDSVAVSANGYIYLVGGRSAAATCTPKAIVAPVSANTTIASGNNPTGVGEWYETNVIYSGDRYGAAVAYDKGKIYTMGGGCTAPLTTNRHYYSSVNSQPQVAIYSRMIDTDTDVFPTYWLMNGLDNSIGARWNLSYRSMNDTDGVATDCGSADMPTWGQETVFGEVTLGSPQDYIPRDTAGNNINCARYFYFYINIDASKTFGYPEDVNRGPTIADLTLFFTSDPSKRLRHGKTFTGGEQQPLDTPPLVISSGPGLQGPNSGNVFSNDSSYGDVPWLNPGNAYASDDTFATVTLDSPEVSEYLRVNNFGYSIPSSAIINGIEILMECESVNNMLSSRARIIKNGNIGVAERATGAECIDPEIYTLGTPTDLWGEAWTPDDINNSNFGFAFAMEAGLNSGQVDIDYISINVYYTIP